MCFEQDGGCEVSRHAGHTLLHHHSPSKSRPNVPALSPLMAPSMAEESCRTASTSSSPIPSLSVPEPPWWPAGDTPNVRWRASSLSVPLNESIELRSGFKLGCSESAFRTAMEVADKRSDLYLPSCERGVTSYLSLRIEVVGRSLDRPV